MASSKKIPRRSILTSLSAFCGGLFFFRWGSADGLTPSATEGPFYPKPSMRMKDADNDLVRVAGLVQEAGGELIRLRGKITDREGKPQANHRIEIWQCDLNGKYLHPGDTRSVIYDQGFQGFGQDITSENGEYSFRTIKPGAYPGRTPHIHVKVFDGERELLSTQFYIADHPQNRDDVIFGRLSDNEAKSVSMVYIETDQGTETTVNVII